MKDYIVKDEVLKILSNPDLGMAERIELLPTITKADICREFKAIDLLLEWAIECDFDLDSFPEETAKYQHLFTDDMSYKDCMIKVAESVLAEKEQGE